MKGRHTGLFLSGSLGLAAVALLLSAQSSEDRRVTPKVSNRPGAIALAVLRYGDRNSARCFSESFLELLAHKTSVPVPPRLITLDLSSPELLGFPFCVLSGEGYFEFTGAERTQLRRYIEGGGFVLASAGCSSPAWDRAFREEIEKIFPESVLQELPGDHVLYRVLFQTWPLRLKNGGTGVLHALRFEGRIALVYCDAGLNDTDSLPDCCCCTGNEVVESRAVNANILLFALLGSPER